MALKIRTSAKREYAYDLQSRRNLTRRIHFELLRHHHAPHCSPPRVSTVYDIRGRPFLATMMATASGSTPLLGVIASRILVLCFDGTGNEFC